MLNIWSLFSGIGGLERGLEQAGLGRTVLQCEIEEFPRSILAKHWPDAVRVKDIRNVTSEALFAVPKPDLICGGFPCQPVSLAGKGKAQADERWLWPEFERVIGEFQPAWVVAENVPGLRKRGLIDVLRGLASLGYDAEWIRLSAAAVGAPHLRERLFIVAYSGSTGRPEDAGRTSSDEEADGRRSQEDHVTDGTTQGHRGRERDPSGVASDPNADTQGRVAVSEPDGRAQGEGQAQPGPDPDGVRSNLADAISDGLQGEQQGGTEEGTALGGGAPRPWIFTPERRKELPINSFDTDWRTEPAVGRVAYGVPDRVDRLKALGNAVVPQCAEFVGRCIKDAIGE